MDLPPGTLAHVARLARLRLEADETERLERDILGILEQFASLPDLPAEDLAAAPAATLRADVARPSAVARDALLSNVPDLEEGRIRVRRAGGSR